MPGSDFARSVLPSIFEYLFFSLHPCINEFTCRIRLVFDVFFLTLPLLCLHCCYPRGAAETPGGMNFVDAQMARRMGSRTVQEFNENIQVQIEAQQQHFRMTSN